MYFSLSRTSLLALMLAGAATVAVGFSFKPDTWAADLSHTLSQPTVMLGGILVLALVALQWTTIQSDLESFLAKDSGNASVVQALEASRGNLMSRSMRNFWEHPVTGIGFGAPSDPVRFARQLERGPYGIPLSASVEKGFMPTAVLEETGIVGAILTILLLIFLFVPALQHPDPTLFWMMATCLSLNFGEMVFFSIGGMGFFLWFVMAFCHVAALRPGAEKQGMHTRTPAYAGRGRQ
jgi:O-antigen ligase